MDGEQGVGLGGLGLDEAGARRLQGLADPIGAGRHLGAGGSDPDPDLAPRVVQPDAVAPHRWASPIAPGQRMGCRDGSPTPHPANRGITCGGFAA